MKRNLDLARQLLLDIENRGASCATSALQSDPNDQREEQIRYHLRLMIDGGFLKEVDRTNEGVPCVRLTQDGHELLELARNDTRWREAKRVCWERTGGLSLKIISGLLTRWAMSGPYRMRKRRRAVVPIRYENEASLGTPLDEPHSDPGRSWGDPGRGRAIVTRRYQEEGYPDVDVRYVRVHPEYIEDREQWDRLGVDLDGDGLMDVEVDACQSDTIL
jgi:hypothetical protein